VAGGVEVDPPLLLVRGLYLVAAGAQGQDLGLGRRQVVERLPGGAPDLTTRRMSRGVVRVQFVRET
jgi:hypothetical protein